MSLYGTLKNLGPLDLEKKMKWGGGGRGQGGKRKAYFFHFKLEIQCFECLSS